MKAAIEQNPAQDKPTFRPDETMSFEGVRVNDPAWDLAMITSIDMTSLNEILHECTSGALAAGGRNRTDSDRGGRSYQLPRFRCRPDQQRHIT